MKENRPKGKIRFKNKDQTEKKRYKGKEKSIAGSRTWFICKCKQLLDHCTTGARPVLKN